MSRDRAFNHLNSLENLEIKLMPTSCAPSELLCASVTSNLASVQSGDDDPPPEPEPTPPPYPGDDPPYPIVPPVGPAGPGS